MYAHRCSIQPINQSLNQIALVICSCLSAACFMLFLRGVKNNKCYVVEHVAGTICSKMCMKKSSLFITCLDFRAEVYG